MAAAQAAPQIMLPPSTSRANPVSPNGQNTSLPSYAAAAAIVLVTAPVGTSNQSAVTAAADADNDDDFYVLDPGKLLPF